MSDKLIKQIAFGTGFALLTFAAVWGVYIMVLSFSAVSGEPSVGLSISIALLVQLLIYRAAILLIGRLPRWLSCALVQVPIMLIFALSFKGGGGLEAVGDIRKYDLYLVGGAVGFAAVTGFWELLVRFIPDFRHDEQEEEEPPEDKEKD
ncbi:MAG: hypothetical protein IJ561_00870 [Ruminococcus sp.]|nr:hypothetical protein [Ruminococcus sp.]